MLLGWSSKAPEINTFCKLHKSASLTSSVLIIEGGAIRSNHGECPQHFPRTTVRPIQEDK